MLKSEKGTWTAELMGDLHGVYYNYLVTTYEGSAEVVDPYAKACGVNGKRGMVVDLNRTNPQGWDLLKTAPLIILPMRSSMNCTSAILPSMNHRSQA